ncbi:MAG: hypothetical protein M1818_003438 [Claussenomyces sp. TS43310]|nr:MAG: hypothetical protein M1818_003438 [Claussenomyces sp. TS43310]
MSFTAPAPSPPVTSPVSPASPSRPGRLRGLSYRYLRHYTNNHHQHSRDPSNASATSVQPSALTRATSHPTTAPNPPANRQTATDNLAGRQLASRAIPAEPRPTADQPNSESDTGGPTSGWLPTVGGQSVASRIATEPQPTATGISSALLSASNSGAEDGAFATVVGRSRSSTTGPTMGLDTVPVIAAHPQLGDPQLQYGSMPSHIGHSSSSSAQLPSIRFSQHQDIRAPRPSLVFSPMSRTLPTGKEIIRVGRYSEREAQPSLNSTSPSAAPVGFKSKVVSRRHCEFWLQDAVWYIKDVKSSSGTFLNHVRLSSPGTESKPFPVKDGDIVQLGIDFKGGEEMIFRCVKIRIELNRGWQSSLNSFKYVEEPMFYMSNV